MPVTLSDYLLRYPGVPAVYVQAINNSTTTAYVSASPSDGQGLFTLTGVPAGTYTLNFGPTNTGPWTATGDTNYVITDPAASGGSDPLKANLASPTFTGVVTSPVFRAKGGPWFDVMAYGAVGDGTTDDTAAINSALAAVPTTGGKVFFPYPPVKYLCNSALVVKANTTLEGVGLGSKISYSGTGTFITLTALAQVRAVGLAFEATNAGASTLWNLASSFRCSFNRCIFMGTHTAGTPQLSSIGVNLSGTSGDNRFVDCDFSNLGTGIQTTTAMSYCLGCIFSTCHVGAYGTGGAYGAGHSFSNCTFVSGATATTYHVNIDTTAAMWWFDACWLEGCGTAMQIGSGANGPYSVGISNTTLAATTADLILTAATETLLSNVNFQADPAQTPTELTINATNAAEGQAINLRSFQNFKIADTVFPVGWTVLSRGSMRPPATVGTGASGINIAGLAAGAGIVLQATANIGTDIPLKVLRNGTSAADLVQVYNNTDKVHWIDQYEATHFVLALYTGSQIYPGNENLTAQGTGGLLHATGIPSNTNGNNNDWCISDNGHIYFRAAGAWVQKI